MFGKGGGGDGGAGAARQQQQQREMAINSGRGAINQTFDSQFTPTFFDDRRKAYLDFAMPQVDDQFADAQKQLTYWLDRNGTLDSTARTSKEAELQKLYDTNKRTVSDRALSYENTLKSDIERARADLYSMLASTGDVSGATSGALTRASALSAPDAYDPIGQMFGTFTGALGTQAGLEKNAVLSGGAVKPRYNTGLFGGSDSVKVY